MSRTAQSPAAPRRLTGGSRGFTLIELLVVMAIIGIISAAGISSFIRESRVNAVKQAAIQLQTDLETLRSSTIRFNGDSSVALNTDGKGYSLSIATGGTPRTVVRTFENGVTTTRTAGTDVVYTAPLSMVGTIAPLQYQITQGDISDYVKVIGVTGRAVFSANP